MQAAIPGLSAALAQRAGTGIVTAALVQDRGDGLPVGGPSVTCDDDGRVWKLPKLWTVDDYRLNLAWYREPGAPAAQLAALIAYGEARWPGEDFSRGPWPDTSDLPSWAQMARYAAQLNDEDDDEDEPPYNPIPPEG